MTEGEWDPVPIQPAWTDEDEQELNGAREAQRRRLMWLSIIGALLVAGGVGLTVWLILAYDRASEQDDRIDQLEGINDERDADLGRLVEGVDALRRQVEALGGVPVVPSGEDLVVEQGATDPDDPERQDIEIQDPEPQEPEAQEPEVDDPDPNDPDPDDPDPDDPVTFEQLSTIIADALADFCEARDDCQGPMGVAGQDGADGTTSCLPGFHFALINIPSHEATFLVCVQD